MDEASDRHFGDLLKRYRQLAGLTQEGLAERAEMSVRGLIYLERGKRRPYPHTVQQLAAALALGPRERTLLERAARRGRATDPLHATAFAARGILPISPTQLVGRDRELASLAALVQRPGVRMISLTGPGGVGKTRLALAVAEVVQQHFAAGVVLVMLASLRQTELVGPAIAQALGVEAGDRPPGEALTALLRDQQLLLVLDNFEHVAAAAPLLGELLAGCPRLRVLATSRAPIRVRGEQVVPVLPLALANPLRRLTPAEAAEVSALALLLQCAQAIKPSFSFTRGNVGPIADICARLDGLPLAIELAAAHLAYLTPQALLARLEHRLPLLTGGARDLPARQQTLHNTIAWSHDLLDPAVQALFRRLAVFAGGCALEAADAVCRTDGDTDVQFLEQMSDLVEQSLVRAEEQTDGSVRLTMLETIREYARERLEASGDARDVSQRHAAYVLALAEQAEPQLTGPEQTSWLARLEREHDNLRAALGWALQHQMAAVGVQLAGALQRFWEMHGYLGEGRSWLEALLALPEHDTTAIARAKALKGAARLAWAQGDRERAAALGEQSLRLYRTVGDSKGIAANLNLLGLVRQAQGDYESAAQRFDESLALCRALTDTRGIAAALNNLGEVARAQGDYQRASALYGQSLALFRTLPDTQTIADVLLNLGLVVLEQGDYESAMASYDESLQLFKQARNHWGVAYSLEGKAATCAHQQPERAARLCGTATALRELIGAPLLPGDRAGYDRAVAVGQAALGEAAWAGLVAGAARMLLEAGTAALDGDIWIAIWEDGQPVAPD